MRFNKKTTFLSGILAVCLFSGFFAFVQPVDAQVLDFFRRSREASPSATLQPTAQPTVTPSPSPAPTDDPVASQTPALTTTITPAPTASASALLQMGVIVTNGTDTVAVRDEDILYVGGKFTEIAIASGSSELRNYLSSINLEVPAITDWNPNPNDVVRTVFVDEDFIFAGGQFTQIAGQGRPYIALFDKQTLELLDWNPQPNGPVYAITQDTERIYIGGEFSQVGGQPRQNFAVFSRENGSLETMQISVNGPVYSIAADEESLYIGGEYTNINGQERRNLSLVNRESGEVNEFRPQVNGRVETIQVADRRVIVTGPFQSEDGQTQFFRQVIDTETGETVSSEVLAQDPDAPLSGAPIQISEEELGFKIPNLADVLTFVIRIFFTIAGLVALLYLLLGAFSWITSGGDEDNVKKSREKITAAVIGVILIVAVLAIVVTLEQVVFREAICFGISCAATIPNLLTPCGGPNEQSCQP